MGGSVVDIDSRNMEQIQHIHTKTRLMVDGGEQRKESVPYNLFLTRR